jgi:hypothetical protein
MDQRSVLWRARLVLIGVAAVIAVTAMALLGVSAGVGTDDAIPAGPAAVPTAVTINANADAYVDSGKPSVNYGSASDLYVALHGSPTNVQQTLARFSLAAIPAGASIDEARFELYLKSASGLAAVNLTLGRNAVTLTGTIRSGITWRTSVRRSRSTLVHLPTVPGSTATTRRSSTGRPWPRFRAISAASPSASG